MRQTSAKGILWHRNHLKNRRKCGQIRHRAYVAPTNTKLCRVNIQNTRASEGPGAGETCFMFQHEQSNWASVSNVIRVFSNKVKEGVSVRWCADSQLFLSLFPFVRLLDQIVLLVSLVSSGNTTLHYLTKDFSSLKINKCKITTVLQHLQ